VRIAIGFVSNSASILSVCRVHGSSRDCGLRVVDVDLNGSIISVRRSAWEGGEQTPKTKNAVRKIGIDCRACINPSGTHGPTEDDTFLCGEDHPPLPYAIAPAPELRMLPVKEMLSEFSYSLNGTPSCAQRLKANTSKRKV
jgi:hypothetical protein